MASESRRSRFLSSLLSSYSIVLFVLLFLSSVCPLTTAFYLPGLAPVNYCETADDPSKCSSDIPVYVNRLDSVESVLPYEYSHFDFCEANKDHPPSENLGQVIFGERIHSSPYNFKFKQDANCQSVCNKTYDPTKAEDKKKLDFMRKGILLNYQHHWIVDNMPVTWCYEVETSTTDKYCATGILIS